MKKIKIKLGESGSFGWVFWFSSSLIWHMLWFFFSQPNNYEQIFLSINNLDVSGIMAWVNITKKLPPTKNFVQTVWCITSYVVKSDWRSLFSLSSSLFVKENILAFFSLFFFPVSRENQNSYGSNYRVPYFIWICFSARVRREMNLQGNKN